MSDIYKIYELNESNIVSKITVFYGESELDINDLFIKDPNNSLFKDVFSKYQLDQISKEKTSVLFTRQFIYLDDSIQTIKLKLINAYSNNIAFEEIYLFSKQIKNVNNISIYDSLTHNNYFNLTQDIILQFLSNIPDYTLSKDFTFKEKYDFNDIIDLNIPNNILVNIPLGQHIISGNDIYNFTVNPFMLISFTKILNSHINNLISTNNKELLLSNGFIHDNTIYFCNAKNILQNSINENISEKITTQLYLPYLAEKDINDMTKLENEHLSLIEKNKSLITSSFLKQVDNIRLFHNIYDTRKSELSYLEQGIKKISFIINQQYSYNLPLDVVFKLIHANENIPFIKFNPHKKKQNIYRLYCDKISKNGKKIPFLSKSNIFKLMKSIKGSKKVSCYIEHLYENDKIPIIVEFDTFANIYISAEFKSPISITQLDNIFKESVNPLINIIQEYVANSGYIISNYNTIYDSNIEILNINYNAYISIDRNINLNSLVGCVSSVFNILVGELQKGIVLRYKRVSNFNEMESIDAFIVELLNNSTEDSNIVTTVMDNFQLTENNAKMKIAELLNNLQVVQNLGHQRSLKIKNNPGFITKISQDQFKQNIMIDMENINNIFYLSTIPIYIDSIIRITQLPESSNIELSTINSLCKVKEVDDEVEINEIIAPSEKPIAENISVGLIAQDLTFGNLAEKSKEKSINVMDFLFDDDDSDISDNDDSDSNEDQNIELRGGLNDSDSDDGISVDLNNDSDSDDGISVDLNNDSDSDDGISVDLNNDSDSDDGISVDLNNDSDSDDGISIDLNNDSDSVDGISVDLNNDSDSDDGISVDLNNISTSSYSYNKSSPEKVKTPSPEKVKTPSPEKVKTPSPEKVKTPSPEKVKTPSPEKMKTPSPEKVKTPSPEKMKIKQNKYKGKKLSIQDNKIEKDITGMRLADPNPFFRAMNEKDPVLFLTESDSKYGNYSRICAWNKRRQPVILTDEEKEIIDKDHPGSYEHAIKYGSSPDKKYWYICPRYWDLKRNVSLTEAQVKSGKYGNIIPDDEKAVPPGANIWEFKETKQHIDKDGNYITNNPGFLKSDKHPDGLCVPCCFKNWDGIAQIKRRLTCLQDKSDKDKDKDKDKKPLSKEKQKQIQIDEYIKAPDKFPLEISRFGYLPVIAQIFLGIDNKQCQISITNTNLKKDFPCYLRTGVEHSKNKSFIGVIADAYSTYNNNNILSIKEFINKIIEILTLDIFVEVQNGNLINLFKDKSKDVEMKEYLNIKKSKIYLKLNKNHKDELNIIITAYNNFIAYLINPESEIDYEYLWDILSIKNNNLFPKGLNLIIMELPQDDITSNINIICPTNFYSINKFDENKETLLILKKYEYFEPIYIVIDKGKSGSSYRTTKLFSKDIMNKIANLKKLKNTIIDLYRSMCKPLSSISNIAEKGYNFKTLKFTKNMVIEKIIEILDTYNLPIKQLVLNYDNKVIGLITSIDEVDGFIPSFPSGILDYPVIYFEDELMNSKDFENTVKFLNSVKKATNNLILCKPVVKVLEDKLIVGLLTETNQFIELKEPEQDTDMTIKESIDEENFYEVNKNTQKSNKVDEDRIIFIKKIKIETDIYNKFRNKLKYLLNQYENIKIRDEIESTSNSPYLLYHKQLQLLIKLIKKIMGTQIEFVNNNNINLFEKDSSSIELLTIPKSNLMNGLDNEELYFNKLADELIRYNRIKLFMFEPKIFLSFSDINYNLNDNEIILLQSLLTKEYFDNLVPIIDNKYISFNTYDTVEPNKSINYDNSYKTSNKLIIDDNVNNNNNNINNNNNNINTIDTINTINRSLNLSFAICNYEIKDIFSKLLLKFRGGYKEIFFSSERPSCSFDIALVILNNLNEKDNFDIKRIKTILIEEYDKLFVEYKSKVINIFSYYGKVGDDNKLDTGNITISELIMDDNYLLSIFDLLVLSNKFSFPLTLISTKLFKENSNEYISLNVTKGDTLIVRTPIFNKYKPTIPKYKLIINKNKESLLEIKKLPNENIKKTILDQKNTLVSLLLNFNSQN